MTWLDVNNACVGTINFIKDLINWIVSFLTNSAIFDDLNSTVSGSTLISAIQSTAITLCVLFFLIDFFQKSLHLQWVTWENIVMFFMKLIIAKIILSNAGLILSFIQNGFNSMLESVSVGTNFGAKLFPRPITHIPPDSNGNAPYVQYFISPSYNYYEKICEGSASISVVATFYNIQIFLIGLIMKIVFIIAAIITIARVFELLVYTAITPLPLATLSCDGFQDIGKNFLKSYVAVCLQAIVIVIMFIVFAAIISSSFLDLTSIDAAWRGQLKLLMVTFVFGAGIMQSGNWAKKICGAM